MKIPKKIRSIKEVGPGDFVKLADKQWHEIESHTFSESMNSFSRHWVVRTVSGEVVDMLDVFSYAKKEDLNDAL